MGGWQLHRSALIVRLCQILSLGALLSAVGQLFTYQERDGAICARKQPDAQSHVYPGAVFTLGFNLPMRP